MDDIKEIYYGEIYAPFLAYCELHDYKRMSDLAKVPFQELHTLLHVSPTLASRIKMICYSYYKSHPDCLQDAKRNQKKAADCGPEDLEEQLKAFFVQNPNRLIRLAEITKSLEKGVRRDGIVRVLEQADWCKIVDKSTFFYAPEQ